jgi:O-antigen ligase/polysaccharide polymerase Wzy-like membrane protein/tetratricopeptide repeat protein
VGSIRAWNHDRDVARSHLTTAAGVARWGERLRGVVAESPAFVPCACAVAVFVWFAADEGGFETTTWLPASLFLLALLGVMLFALPAPRPRRAVLVAVALLAGYALWSYLSILWAGQEEVAWDGANRTALYVIVFALFALWPTRGWAAATLLGGLSLGVTAVGLVELLRADHANLLIQYFDEGRLSEPTGYSNANVALWSAALWPALVLAGRREVPSALRGLFLGASVLLADLAILGQSRGWLLILPAMVVLSVVLVPGRGRTIATLAAAGIGVAAGLGPVLDVYGQSSPRAGPGAALDHATTVILLCSAGAALAGFLAALVDRRVTVPPTVARRVSVTLVAAFVVAALGGLVALDAIEGSPVALASKGWREFKQGGNEPHTTRTRFGASLSTYRGDYWRVAWGEFERRPLLGAGSDNFGRDYLKRGRSQQTPAYPHSTELRALSETGFIGGLLLGGALLAALVAAVPGMRRPPEALRASASAAGLLLFAYWLLHGSFDWLWEFAGLGAPAFAALGVASSGAQAARRAEAGRPVLSGRRAVPALAAACLLAASIVAPWLAAQDVKEARGLVLTDPAGALERLDRARSLNPLSPLPDKTAAIVEIERGRLGAARDRLRAVLARDPGDSYAYLQLGAIASREGRTAGARRLVGRARRLAPRDGVTAEVARLLRRGRRVTPARVNALAARDINARIGRQ